MKVLITRPAEEQEVTCELLRASGHLIYGLPLTRIEALDTPLPDLSRFGAVILISRNAARWWIKHFPRPAPLTMWAPGSGTASLLNDAGWSCHYPEETDNSEALFEALQKSGFSESFLIVKGEGGRPWLKTKLAKYSEVASLDVYRRHMLGELTEEQRVAIESFDPDCISITSGQGLESLLNLFSHEWLKKRQILLPGKRLEQLARSSGLANVWMLTNAKPETILRCLDDRDC